MSQADSSNQSRVAQLQQSLQKLIGLHRQLLETVRVERDALLSADVKSIQETTLAKEALVENVRAADSERLRVIGEMALAWRRPARELTLSNVIIVIQGEDLKLADQLRSSQTALSLLIQRTQEQNLANRKICERSLETINVMKKNVLGEAEPKAEVYSSQGQRINGSAQSRLISREA